MIEEINWKKEILSSKKFNNKVSQNILENGGSNFMQEIYIGYMYARWKKIRGLDLPNHFPNINKKNMISPGKE